MSKYLVAVLSLSLLPILFIPAANATAPGAPTIGTPVAGNGYLEVPITAAASGTLTNYQYSVDGGISWTTRDPIGTWSPLTIHGLTNGTAYSVRIRGVNTDGTGTASNAVSGTPNSRSTTQNSQGFLQGAYVEVGVRANGAFGSGTAVPSGFHGTEGSCLGFRVDRQKNGWGSPLKDGSDWVNIDDGDYFCPGAQYEGWGLQVGSNDTAFNNDGSPTDIPGAVADDVIKGTSEQSVEWNSTNPSNGIRVKQVAIVPNLGQSLHVDVTLTNSTGSRIDNIYYVRGFDPDNSTGDSSGGATASSTNKVNSVGGIGSVAELQATFDSGALVMMRSTDSRARAAVRTSDCCDGRVAIPSEVWGGSSTWLQSLDALSPRDAQVAIAFKVESLDPGTSTTFRVSYVLSANDALSPSATTVAATNVSTSDTATVNATVNANGSGTTVEFEYGTTSDLSGSNEIVLASGASGSSPTSISKNLEGLTPGTTYYYRVIATNSVGVTRGNILSFTPIALPVLTIIAASNIGDTTTTLSALVNPKGGNANTITFTYSTSSTFASDTYTATSTPSTATGTSNVPVSKGVESLTAGATYYYKISATNEAGTSTSSVLNFTTTPAPAVTTSDADTVTATSATLNGTVNPFGVATSELIFEYSTVSDLSSGVLTVNTSPSSANNSSVNNLTATLSGLTTGTTYYYRTKATTANGTNFGAIKSFTPKAAPSVTTATPSVSGTTVTFNGVINPNGAATETITATYSQLSPLLETSTATVLITPSVLTGATDQNVSYILRGLTSGATYYVRFSATNSVNTTTGSIVSFTMDTVDTTQPTATITTSSDTFGKTENIVVTITFSEPVTGFSSADLTVGGASTGWSKGSAVTVSTSVYRVTLTPSSASTGSLNLDVGANTVLDNSDNNNLAATRKTLEIVDTVAAPNISYTTSTINGVVSTAITSLTPSNSGGMVDTWTISPSLPAGLRINSTTGVISGTPTVTAASATYTVTGTNGSGASTATSTATVTVVVAGVAASVPNAPTIGTATATGGTTATITYIAPGSDGGATITSYTATSSPGGITGSISQAGSGTISITGLAAGTTYTFTVVATNSVGNSSPSAASNAITTTSTSTSGLVPTFSTVTTAANGFTINVTNYNASYTWSVTVTAPATVTISSAGLITVSGLSGQGTPATVTVTTTRTGYTTQSASVSGTTNPPPPPPNYLYTLTPPTLSKVSTTYVCIAGTYEFVRAAVTKEIPNISFFIYTLIINGNRVSQISTNGITNSPYVGPSSMTYPATASKSEAIFELGVHTDILPAQCEVLAYQENAVGVGNSNILAKATPSVSWPSILPITATTKLGSAQLNAAADVEGTFTYSVEAGSTLEVGKYTLTVTFTPKDVDNYEVVVLKNQLRVLTASISIRNSISIQAPQQTIAIRTSSGALKADPEMFLGGKATAGSAGFGIEKISISGSSVTIWPVKGFSGKTSLGLVQSGAGGIINIVQPLIVVPNGVSLINVNVLNFAKPTLNWSAVQGATSYLVTANGVRVCSAVVNTCISQIPLGPKSSVSVTVTGKDLVKTTTQPKIAVKADAEAASVKFDSGGSTLSGTSRTELLQIARLIRSLGYTQLSVIGHTDAEQGVDNTKLSEGRANAVLEVLKGLLPGVSISVKGQADSEPVASNNSEAGKAKNRRVEIRVIQLQP